MKRITIGLDIAKSVFQVHGEDSSGNVVLQKRLRRSQVLGFFAGLEPALIGIEACGSALTGAASCGRWVTRCG
jgi:transposase